MERKIRNFQSYVLAISHKWHAVCMILIKLKTSTPHFIHRNELLFCKVKECDENQRMEEKKKINNIMGSNRK